MPKFDVTLTHTRSATISIEVSAKDDDAAQDKAEKAVRDLDYDPKKIANTFDAEWQEDDDNIEVDSAE